MLSAGLIVGPRFREEQMLDGGLEEESGNRRTVALLRVKQMEGGDAWD